MSFDVSQLPAHARGRNPHLFNADGTNKRGINPMTGDPAVHRTQPVGVESGKEHELHEDIRKECIARGWIPLHSRMDMPCGRIKGEPDFIILATFPTAYLVECKTRTGKLSPDQVAFAHWAQRLGWTVHVVRSLKEFQEVIGV